MKAFNRRKTCREHINFITKQHKLSLTTTTFYGIKNSKFYAKNVFKIIKINNNFLIKGKYNIYSPFISALKKITNKKEKFFLRGSTIIWK